MGQPGEEGPLVGRGSYGCCDSTQGVPCDREGETSPERCLTCLGLHSTVSHSTGYAAPYLTVLSENAIDVFDVRKAEWVQTVPLKKVRARSDPWGWTGVWSGSMA